MGEGSPIEICLFAPELCIYLLQPTKNPADIAYHVQRLLEYAFAKNFVGSPERPEECKKNLGFAILLMYSPSKGFNSVHLRMDLPTYFALRKELNPDDEAVRNIREWGWRYMFHYCKLLEQDLPVHESRSNVESLCQQRAPAPHGNTRDVDYTEFQCAQNEQAHNKSSQSEPLLQENEIHEKL
mmetsp:Transcript_4004/g.6986  ORF Transcript_4004/g.6986 Transcript_4004/m.6986 type:complete len:183 (+) Transcript_4004:147-695(+)